jgi:hypothetical protein
MLVAEVTMQTMTSAWAVSDFLDSLKGFALNAIAMSICTK